MKRLFLIFSSTIAILTATVYYLVTFHPKDSDWYKFGFTLLQVASQLVLVAVFGGALVQEFNRRRTKKQALKEFRKTVFRDITRAYTDTKRARRHLRAKCFGLDNSKEISRNDYMDEMQSIIDIELRFEVIRIELKSYEDIFNECEPIIKNGSPVIVNGKEKQQLKIVTQLKVMEDYLHDNLISEYENALSGNNNIEILSLSKLPALTEFIKKADSKEGSTFEKSFREAFKKSLNIIKAES